MSKTATVQIESNALEAIAARSFSYPKVRKAIFDAARPFYQPQNGEHPGLTSGASHAITAVLDGLSVVQLIDFYRTAYQDYNTNSRYDDESLENAALFDAIQTSAELAGTKEATSADEALARITFIFDEVKRLDEIDGTFKDCWGAVKERVLREWPATIKPSTADRNPLELPIGKVEEISRLIFRLAEDAGERFGAHEGDILYAVGHALEAPP
jgi:hypothetical protein